MWPWEHLAAGYLTYSLFTRVTRREPPSSGETLVLVFATQLPDLVDKPLAWLFGVLPSGLSLAHSLVVGLPVCLVVLAVTRRLGSGALGSAYCVGYLSHLAGDLVYPLALGGFPDPSFLLWPLTSATMTPSLGFLARVASLWDSFAAFAVTPRGRLYLLVEACLLVVTFALWLVDGRPGLPHAWRQQGETTGPRT